MSDDSLDLAELAEALAEPPERAGEAYEYDTGVVIFPSSAAQFVLDASAILMRISDKTGEPELLYSIGTPWRAVTKADPAAQPAQVRSLKIAP